VDGTAASLRQFNCSKDMSSERSNHSHGRDQDASLRFFAVDQKAVLQCPFPGF
jgi:hypothetical protein